MFFVRGEWLVVGAERQAEGRQHLNTLPAGFVAGPNSLCSVVGNLLIDLRLEYQIWKRTRGPVGINLNYQ